MLRAGLTLIRRVIVAASLLVLLICGAEVAVRVYEAATGDKVCTHEGACNDPSRLSVPSWSIYQELRPMAAATVTCRDSNTTVDLRTNSLGLRGPDVVVPKPPHLFRIVVLGDETIFAPETEDADHFCTLLRERLQARSSVTIEVINGAIPGHCPLTEYLLFKQRLLALQPDLVLLHFDWSDVGDDRQIRRPAICDDDGVPQSCPHGSLAGVKKNRPHEVWREKFRLVDWTMSSLGAEWRQQIAQQRAVSRDSDTNPYAWLRDERPAKNISFRNAIRPIDDLNRLCQSQNISFALMTSPKPWQVSERCSRGEGVRLVAGVAPDAYFSNRAPFDVLARFADKTHIPFLDGSIVLSSGREAESNFLRYAPRWSPVGHQRMADFVAVTLCESLPGPWEAPYSAPNEQPVLRSDPPRESPIQWTGGQRGPNRFVQEPARQLR
jgi:hypothetical protein